MASLTLHYSITTAGDNDKAAPELDHSGQDESQTRVLKEEMAHMHNVGEHTSNRMGSYTLKITITIASGTPFSYSRRCSNNDRTGLMIQNLTPRV